MTEIFNFGAGPAVLPKSVLETVRAELLDYHGLGYSILEMGHRTPAFKAILSETQQLLRELLDVPDTYEIIFCQGGGRSQFAMVPMNLAREGCGAYIVNGTWSLAAKKEAQKFCKTVVAASAVNDVPLQKNIVLPDNASYLYYCANETVHGIEFPYVPLTEDIPLVCDMSSSFLSRPVDVSRFGVLWAVAQKNFAPAGLTVVIIRRELLGNALLETPSLMNYTSYADTESMPNTPPVFQIYVANLVAKWILASGGLTSMQARNIEKATLVYDMLDRFPEVYKVPVSRGARSRMNVVFHMNDEALTAEFIAQASQCGLLNLAGHRSVGGIRASLYNAMPLEGALALTKFLERFAQQHVKY